MLHSRLRSQAVRSVNPDDQTIRAALANDTQTSCIDKAAAGVGCNDPTDFACQCKNTEAINGAALNCVLSGCGAQTGLAVQASASAVCACVSSAGSSPQATSAPESLATTLAVPTGHGPEVTQASSTVAASSTSAATAAPFPTVSQISDGQVQATGAAPASSASASSGGTSNSTVPFTGAGVKAAGSVGSVLAAIAAAVAAL